MKRTESRGCHLRYDYPNEDPNFLKHIDQSQETLIKDLKNIQSKSELFIEKSFAN